ncbi:DNA replication complex GINS protein PSF2 [Gracilariopsis chorda]|uniref:DNA replication complex GINS protein PSF2 n=1 Tax=Gracilariopsis chorda TaxID=448386 RepID=A0A2V3IXM4_9FLOR|nr:DNA replication complex GINS protein PSF2 [Gracilariopsis chorda]|eukprot:PXF46813.1 DNA replication complex GINS protein PSF2 [Gracilariopsis chorda]
MGDTAAAKSTQAHESELTFQRSEFFAEDELIEINPMVRFGVISFIRGNFGPFEPSITTTVPLWLALALKKVHRCKIIPPRWLTVRSVEEYLSEEKDNEDELQSIPFYFSEIASLLFHHAPDDLVQVSNLRRLIEDLTNLRESKMRKWMQANVRDRANAIKVNNLSMHEINIHRPVLTRVLQNMYEIHVTTDGSGPLSETNTSSNPASESEPRPLPGRQLRRVIRRD